MNKIYKYIYIKNFYYNKMYWRNAGCRYNFERNRFHNEDWFTKHWTNDFLDT